MKKRRLNTGAGEMNSGRLLSREDKPGRDHAAEENHEENDMRQCNPDTWHGKKNKKQIQHRKGQTAKPRAENQNGNRARTAEPAMIA
jgi:hypothetical protein